MPALQSRREKEEDILFIAIPGAHYTMARRMLMRIPFKFNGWRFDHGTSAEMLTYLKETDKAARNQTTIANNLHVHRS